MKVLFFLWHFCSIISDLFLLHSLTSLYLGKNNERSEYSYIGLGDFFVFFSGKSLKIC